MRTARILLISLLISACGSSSNVRYIVEGEGVLRISYVDEKSEKIEVQKESTAPVFIAVTMSDDSFTAELTVECGTENSEQSSCRPKAARIEVGGKLIASDEGGTDLFGQVRQALHAKVKCSEGTLSQSCKGESNP